MVILKLLCGHRGRLHLLALLVALFAPGCTSFFFHPTSEHVVNPGDLGLAWRDVWFRSTDGVRLHGWFLPADGQQAKGTIVFLHGNAQNISTHLGSVAWLPGQGFNVFLFDYRGYGSSEGVAELEGLHRDSEAAMSEAYRLDGVDPDRVIVFGQSLGGTLAIDALALFPEKPHVRALIVEGAFAGYRRIARDVLSRSWLTWPLQWPLSLAVDDSYDPLEAIATLAPIPVLIIQGKADVIIAPTHARDLYTAAGEPKALWLVPDAPHIGALGTQAMRQRFLRYLETCALASREESTDACRSVPRTPIGHSDLK